MNNLNPCSRCGSVFFAEGDNLYKCSGCGSELRRGGELAAAGDERERAFAEVRAIMAGVGDPFTVRNPYQVLDRITQLCGGISPSEWAKYNEQLEARPKTWATSPAMRSPGYRGVRTGDRVPCPACDGLGYRFGIMPGPLRALVCNECDGDAFVEVG